MYLHPNDLILVEPTLQIESLYLHSNSPISAEHTADIEPLYLRQNAPISSEILLQQRKTVEGIKLLSSAGADQGRAAEKSADQKLTTNRSCTVALAKRKHLSEILNINQSHGRQTHPRFSLYSHKPSQVASAVLFFLPGPMVRVSEIDDAFVHIKWYEEMRKRPNQNPEDPGLLSEYLHLFDNMYFCGALGNLLSVEIGQRGFEGMGKKDFGDLIIRKGRSDWELPTGVEGRLRISNLKDLKRFSDPDVRLHHYLGTLLHEAVHAIFDPYVCIKHRRCKLLERECLDIDGHGTLFV